MRLVTFENLAGASRIGAYTGSGQIIDLNSACALRLRDQQHEGAFDRLANALVPPNMRALFEEVTPASTVQATLSTSL
jgi:hypothetical protein